MFDYSKMSANHRAKAEKRQRMKEIDAQRKAHFARLQTPPAPPPSPARVAQTEPLNELPTQQPQKIEASVRIEIPDDWEGLPWPKLRDLAHKIVGEGHEFKGGRAEARAMIAAHKRG